MAAAVKERPSLDIEAIDRGRSIEESKPMIELEKQCVIELHPDSPQDHIDLMWHGGKGYRPTRQTLQRGKGQITTTLGKAMAWFGPFGIALEWSRATDERAKERLFEAYRQEKDRVLNRYDYPRGNGRGTNPDMQPVGPHRFPDVVVTMIEGDGTELGPYRLHELYKIGAWDARKDEFERKESPEQIRDQARTEIVSISARYEEDLAAARRETARLAGLVEGLSKAVGAPRVPAKVAAAAPEAPANSG